MMPHVIWIDHGQCYRIVTSAFVHGGFLHLGFNMYNFVFAGGRLEQMMGTVRFVNLIVVWVIVLGILYFAIAFVGALFQYARFWCVGIGKANYPELSMSRTGTSVL